MPFIWKLIILINFVNEKMCVRKIRDTDRSVSFTSISICANCTYICKNLIYKIRAFGNKAKNRIVRLTRQRFNGSIQRRRNHSGSDHRVEIRAIKKYSIWHAL